MDDFYSKDECQFFMRLSERAAVVGDGYNEERKAPKNENEIFSGLSLSRAALMAARGLLELSDLETFIALSEKTLELTKSTFDLPELHISFTHLVCRSATLEATNFAQMSHEIHADNCIILKNGTCSKEPPAFTWRDFSAIVYLNNEFNGGQLVFVANDLGYTVQEVIEPTCGRIVMFGAGPENLHGVKGVTKGKRCALGVWFTMSEDHSEYERVLAKETAKQMKTEGKVSGYLLNELASTLN